MERFRHRRDLTSGGGLPIAGTFSERYLTERRGLDIRHLDLAHVLRWHARYSCMVALMTDAVTGEPIGIHRTYLDSAGAKRERRMRDEPYDPFDAVSGTTGLTGAADTVLVLSRSSQGTVLYGRGRDIEEIENSAVLRQDNGAVDRVGQCRRCAAVR
jgi:hypothetical protein